MANVIHGASHKAMKFFRKAPAALAVYWIYASRTNNEGVAWPSLRGLSRDTGWSVNACSKAREWLVKHGALERVTDYKRPNWRKLDAPQRQQKINLDRSEYYRPTGQIVVDGNTYPLLYFGQNEPSDIEDDTPDVSRQRTSAARDVAPDDTELDSSTTKLDSIKESASSSDEPSPPQMLMKSHIAKWGKEKLTTYFQENEQEVTPLYNLLGIALAVVPVENLTLTRRRDVTWAHVWMSRALETAGYTVGQYVAWLKTETAWRKGAAKVTVKELMDKVAVFISAQRESPAAAPRRELVPDYRPAPVVDELTPEERAHRLELIRAGRREWEMQTA